MRGALFVAMALSACGRSGYEASHDGGGASGDGAAPGDDGGGPGVDGGPPFMGIEVAPGLEDADADDLDPSLTADLLEIYFTSDRAGSNGRDVFRAERDAVDDSWSEPALVEELASLNYDLAPEVSPDGLTLLLSSNRSPSEGGTDFWITTRETRDDPWDEPTHSTELSTSRAEYGGSTNEAGTRILLTRMNPSTGHDIVESARPTDTDPWPEPDLVTNLAEQGYEADPHIDPAGLTVVLAGELGDGHMRELYISTRADLDAPFDPPTRLTSVSSDDDDDDPWRSPDGALLYFSSNRSGHWQIYQASQ